jgi:succinate dehydrogenase / fumarate reductase cytochrome b subunit
MDKLSLLFRSSVGRKWLNGLTGAFLLAFITAHLLGNFNILIGADAFNGYAVKLWSLGTPVVYAIEVALAVLFLLHGFMGVTVWLEKRKARPDGYKTLRSAGGASRNTVYSRTMIYTGVITLVFLVWHLIQFRFGPHYAIDYHGKEARDLYRLVVEVFKNPVNVILYEAVMILLGFHLRHGFWSAFHTLGVTHPKYARPIYAIGILFAIAVAVGFLAIPLYVYFVGSTS